jgi:Holliday junction resolvasome RuvABC endonuclease subunit
MGVHTGTLKLATVGYGKASKEDMVKWFQSVTGVSPTDDNEADAYALLQYAIKEVG